MLISSLQDIVRELRRPAKRRSRAVTVEFQDLEPRLFLSVNSLLSSVDSPESVDTAVDAFEESGTSTGSPISEEEEGGNETEPAFESITGGSAGEGTDYVSGSVTWPENPEQLEGLEVEVFDANGASIASGETDADGNFYIAFESGELEVTIILKNPQGQEVDETTTLL